MADQFGGVAVDEFGGVAVEEPSKEDALNYATQIPQQITNTLTKSIRAGAEGSEMGREQLQAPSNLYQAAFESAALPPGALEGRERLAGGFPYSESLLPIPSFTPKEGEPGWKTVGKEVGNLALGVPKFITSPLGITTAPVAAVAPTLTAGAFAEDMLSNAAQQAADLYKNRAVLSPTQMRSGVTQVLGQTALAALPAYHATTGKIELPSEEPRAGAQVPVTPEQVTPGAPEPLPVELQATEQARLAKELGQEEQPALMAKVAGAGPVDIFGDHQVTVMVNRTDFEGLPTKDIVGSLPEELRDKAKVERFKSSVVPGKEGPAQGPIKFRLSFKDKADAQKAWDYFKGLESGKELPPATESQPKLTPADLEPGLMVGDKPLTGGEDHGAIRNKALVEANTPEQVDAILAADKDDSKHVFVDKSGNVLTRDQAADALGEKEPLQSSRLRELQKAKPEPEPVGMGAAVAPEFENNPTTPTGIRNAIVDKERVKRGLPEAMQSTKRSFGEVWDKAMAIIDQDPTVQDALIDELRTKPRALTDQEDALILHRQIDLQNEYGKATRDLAQAYDDGRLEDVEREKLRVAGYADKLFDLYNIGKTSGTETARGLSARRMMANEDFTLSHMLNEKRAAQGGTPLSEVQRAEVEALHNKIAALEKQVEDLRKRQEAKRQSDKKGGGKPPTRPPALDPEEQQVNAANQRAKEGWREALARDRLRIRSPLEKTQDALVKWRRAFVLSSPITLAKLTSAAIERMAFTPVEEAIGAGIGRVIPGVAEKARREGGINARAEAKAITEGFTKGMLDSWDVLRTGRSTLDALYGRAAGYPPGVSDFFGHVHGALKSVTKRNEFARSFEKRAAHAISQGVDVTDPMVQSSLAIEAYKDANRSIFQQDNRVISAYKAALRTLEQKSAETGRVPLGSKAVATTGKLLLPVVRIPTNIVAETLQTATGLATGSARLGRAFYKGIENLSPQEADIIMRSLKKGSIGAAVLALGYLNADVIGGYYQPGSRKSGEQGFGTVKLYGHEIPSYLLHNPLLETLQIGATLRKVAESKFKKKEKDEKGLGWGTVGAGMGVLEEVPFLRESMEIAKSLNPTEQRSFFGELFKSLTVPQGVQWWATYRDTDKFGKPIQRKPTTLLEHEESGIPGLRERVPEKKQPKK